MRPNTFAPLLAALALPLAGQTKPANPTFPPSTAEAEGLSQAPLDRLHALVQSFVKDEEIVGAELLVLKNGHAVLHEAYGHKDRDTKTPMTKGSVFCVRSMTKPLVGAAILMLIEARKIAPADKIARYLPSFDVDGKRDITIEHLLTHTSGLPMSELLGKDLKSLAGIRAVADLGKDTKLEFQPGTGFHYSDQGTDTLTALIEVITGKPPAAFLRERILDPLGMHETTCVMTTDHPLRAKACSESSGSRGAWNRFWDPKKPPLFPFFLGSQGLYSTVADYARFLALWQNQGRVGDAVLLGPQLVRRALTPSPQRFPGPTGFAGLRADYGCLMQLWMGENAAGKPEAVAYGHTGSDGTYAWAFPKQNAMVLYFTQSRGNTTGLRVEKVLGQLFLGAKETAARTAPPIEEFLGYYRRDDRSLYRAIIRDGMDLALEVVGKAIIPLDFAGDDRWTLRPNPSASIQFERDEDAKVTAMRMGNRRDIRITAISDVPDLPDPTPTIAAAVAKAHGMQKLATSGPVKLRYKLTIAKIGVEGWEDLLLAAPDRFRSVTSAAGQTEKLAFDGKTTRYGSSATPVNALEGDHATSMRLSSMAARFGDWTKLHKDLTVVHTAATNGKKYLIVRTAGLTTPTVTYFVDAATSRVVREATVANLGSMGRLGRRMAFDDFRDVGGMLLPHKVTTVANPMVGPIESTLEKVELGVKIPDGAFELRK